MPKYQPWMKNQKWMSTVRTFDCVSCGQGHGVQAHHVPGSRGAGLKMPDACCIPLCVYCHKSHHDRNEPSRDWTINRLRELWGCIAVFTGNSGILSKHDFSGMGLKDVLVAESSLIDEVLRGADLTTLGDAVRPMLRSLSNQRSS
jgi:hypothetical protein